MTAERYWESRWRDEYAENQKLVAALRMIASFKDKTLISIGLGTAHEIGANKAFNQAADIAIAALAETKNVETELQRDR